jgi:hypothetical protein
MGVRLFLFFGLLLSACAQVQPLGGGEQDKRPPVPNFERSTPVFASTEVRPKEIRIPFDEYIKLNNPGTNISVTPELATKPKYEVRGRDLFISLEDRELLDNTTYSFVFNKAVSDVNESNDTTFTFVFSTGVTIDSLAYSAVLIDVETQMPVANTMVGLYVPTDSLNPYKHRPKYVAQTDKDGLAQFQYLAEQKLEVFAFFNKDGGKIANNSSIAFLSDVLKIDTTKRQDTLYMFSPVVLEEKGRLLKKDLSLGGKIALVTNFDHDIGGVAITKDNLSVDFLAETTARKDSTFLWIQAEENAVYVLQVPFRDTVLSARIPTRKITASPVKFTSNLTSGELEIQDTLTLTFDLPLKTLDTNQVQVFESDSIPVDFSLQIHNLRQLQILPKANQNRLFIPPGAIEFYNGATFQDTINLGFKRKTENKYANLELILENKPQEQLLLRLHKGKEIAYEKVVPVKDSVLVFQTMQPGEYTLQVIVDLNANGLFDLGDYPSKRQPEPVIWFRQPITLRANWDSSQPVAFAVSPED